MYFYIVSTSTSDIATTEVVKADATNGSGVGPAGCATQTSDDPFFDVSSPTGLVGRWPD